MNTEAEDSNDPTGGKQPSAMDGLFQMEAVLGCAVLAVAALLAVAFCIYVYFWGLKIMP